MWLKFHKDRLSGSREITAADRENVVLRKTRLKFFLMEIFEEVLSSVDQRCMHHTKFLLPFREIQEKRNSIF